MKLTFLVTDINGVGQTGEAANLTPSVFFNQVDESGSATIIESIEGNGYYILDTSVLVVGDGSASMSSSDVNHFISPDWHDLHKESIHTADDIYGISVAGSINSTIIDRSSTYGNVQYQTKAGDDFTEVIGVPPKYTSIDTWSNWSIKVYPPERVTDGTVLPIGSGTVTVLNAAENLLEVIIPNTVLVTGIVPEGVSTYTVYCDIQGTDNNGYIKTPITLKLILNRDYNA